MVLYYLIAKRETQTGKDKSPAIPSLNIYAKKKFT